MTEAHPAHSMSASLIGRLSQGWSSLSFADSAHLCVGHASLRSRLDIVGAARTGRTERRASLLGALRSAADICGFSQTIVHARDVPVIVSWVRVPQAIASAPARRKSVPFIHIL
jgi:hypothetical protein